MRAPDPDLNTARYDALLQQRDVMEAAFGAPLSWEPLETYKSCRLAAYRDGGYCDVAMTEHWDDWADWMFATNEKLRAALTAAGGVPSLTRGAVQ